jgi:preprotein translocase subunit SecD
MNRRRALITLIVTVAIAWGSLAAVLAAGLRPKLGLDLQGGFSVVLVAPEGTDPQTLDQAVEIMRRRIENLGSVQEPEITVQGDRAILVQLPGVEDRERALEAIGTTGVLSMRPVLGVFTESPYLTDPEGEHPASVDPETGLSDDQDAFTEAYLPYTRAEGVTVVMHVGPAFLTGVDLEGGEAAFTQGSSSFGEWVVIPEFTAEGGEKFREATAELAGNPLGSPTRQLAIVVDGEIISPPEVQAGTSPTEGLDPDNVVITIGSPDNPQAEAEDLAAVLRYGALPTTFERERVESVSPTLGADSLRAGLIAGLGGLILVGLYLLLYYRTLGAIAVIGFSVFGSFLITTLILLGEVQGATLTLAGVTAIVVSVGITADSYVVYFERIKEEHRRGRPLRPAIDHAFSSSFRTILTGDAVTFLGAILLWVLAIGSVKAFALTLGIATVIDVIVAYLFTRPAVALVGKTRFGEGAWFSIRAAMGRTRDESMASDAAMVEVSG